jgi:hypothetical protein
MRVSAILTDASTDRRSMVEKKDQVAQAILSGEHYVVLACVQGQHQCAGKQQAASERPCASSAQACRQRQAVRTGPAWRASHGHCTFLTVYCFYPKEFFIIYGSAALRHVFQS